MIQLKDITLKVKDKILLNNYNLTVSEGEKVLLNSISGSGKTSLFRMLLGFQKPESGEILINEQLLSEKNLFEWRQNFSYVSQDVDLPGEDLQAILNDLYSYEPNSHLSYDEEHILQLLKDFKLSRDFLNKEISELSGGERQRLGLIICCLLDRPVWLLDEPTSALDSEIKAILVQNVLETDRTVLVISHDIEWTTSEKMRIERW